MKTLGLSLLLFFSFLARANEVPTPRENFIWKPIGQLAILDRGRIKPLETFALESLLFLTGQRSWKGISPEEFVFGLLVSYDKDWQSEPFVRIDYRELKEKLGLDPDTKYFSPKAIQDSGKLPPLVRALMEKQQSRERQSALDKKVAQLQNQLGLINVLVSGEAWTLLPNPQGISAGWFPLTRITEGQGLPYPQDLQERLASSVRKLVDGFQTRDANAWNSAVIEFVPLVRDELAKGHYPDTSQLKLESFYNHLRAFHWAWILYTFAFVSLLAFLVTAKAPFKWVGMTAMFGAFALHIAGFVIRCLVAGRPPVTNMYESIIWVTWGCVFFSLLIWAAYKNLVIPTASIAFAIVGLIIADNLPLTLDPSIQPLEPVLRSNFWLTIHVLTITLSYAAFALSLCLGNVVLGQYIFARRPADSAKVFTLYMYRAMQIGVVLLAAGTILGGIWADYSWGRFWGWDPKEVWALVALLLYLAVLHGRFSGWLRGFGFAAAAVISFLGVLMAWYGVNFVLGVGLHSYGFGTGGLGWVSAYIAVQLSYIAVSYARYRKLRASGVIDASPLRLG